MFSLRSVLKRLGSDKRFTVLSVLTLAGGIGLAVAIFALVYGVLLAPLPYPHPERLLDVSHGAPGLDLVEAEAKAPAGDPEAKEVLARMDREEAAFAQRLRDLMDARGLTQAQLADKVGIGQPAVSMMLNRACRPQRRTVLRFAEALGVAPEELWPQPAEGE